jgi:GH25 family lysozyme M1 (1,4-beta-N-acetylmuramidase)
MKNHSKKTATAFLILGILVVALVILLAEKSRLDDEVVQSMYTRDAVDEMIDEAYQETYQDALQTGRQELLSELEASLDSGSSVLETLRPYYPDDILLLGDGTYHFVPIKDTIPHNSYQQENLEILESGEYRYLEDGQVVSYKGIDVSAYQGRIDWEKVAADGVDFAIIRAVYRGYGSAGKLMEDERYDTNMAGAIDAGISVGLYVYTQAISDEEVIEEANLAIAKAAKYTERCTIVVDVEKVLDANGRMNALEVSERTRLVALFCRMIEEAGYTPMIYCNLEMAVLLLDMEQLTQYDIWFAAYTDTLYYPYAYSVWQYTEKGSVDGIDGEVDLNLSFTQILSE